VIGKKPFIKGGVKLGFAGDERLTEIKLHIPAAKGYGKLILDNRPGPGFGKIRPQRRFRLPLLLRCVRLGPGLRLRFRRLDRRFRLNPRFRLNLRLRTGLGLWLNGRLGSGFLGRGKFGGRFTSGKGKQNRPYQGF
jgi:hypothetical protein